MSGALVHEAIRDNNREQLILLLDQRPSDANYADINDTTPLILAAQLDRTTLVKILLSRGADPTAQEKAEVGGMSALHYSAINNNREVALGVLRDGGQVNAQDQLGRTPLHLACRHGNVDIVSILLSKGADPDRRDCSGFTPSYWAALEGHAACLEHLPPPQYYGSKQIADFQAVTMDALDLPAKPPQKSGGKKGRKK